MQTPRKQGLRMRGVGDVPRDSRTGFSCGRRKDEAVPWMLDNGADDRRRCTRPSSGCLPFLPLFADPPCTRTAWTSHESSIARIGRTCFRPDFLPVWAFWHSGIRSRQMLYYEMRTRESAALHRSLHRYKTTWHSGVGY